VNRTETEHELRALRRRAEDELNRIAGLIEFIDDYAGELPRKPPAASRRRGSSPSLLKIIQERPGVRGSMLAMVAERDWDEVAEELKELEREGRVQRQGLGWRST
jgi:hypothetical protein